jgi:hypothetical protein
VQRGGKTGAPHRHRSPEMQQLVAAGGRKPDDSARGVGGNVDIRRCVGDLRRPAADNLGARNG